jgi:hypothetical protein
MAALSGKLIGDAERGVRQNPQAWQSSVSFLDPQLGELANSSIQTPDTTTSPGLDAGVKEVKYDDVGSETKQADPDGFPRDEKGCRDLESPHDAQSLNEIGFLKFHAKGTLDLSSSPSRLWSRRGLWEKIDTLIMIFTASVLITLISLLAVLAKPQNQNVVASQQLSSPDGHWTLDGFQAVVTFGDSYTDESRGNYLKSHSWNPPPVGWEEGVVSVSVSVIKTLTNV